jgi:hypothetical protein
VGEAYVLSSLPLHFVLSSLPSPTVSLTISCGSFDVAPTFADLENLPQVTAFYLECYRWRPVSVNGFAHRATEDIIWVTFIFYAEFSPRADADTKERILYT